MASALPEELKTVATEIKRSHLQDTVGMSWAALTAAEEGSQGRGIETLLIEAGGGGGGREGEGRGGGD